MSMIHIIHLLENLWVTSMGPTCKDPNVRRYKYALREQTGGL